MPFNFIGNKLWTFDGWGRSAAVAWRSRRSSRRCSSPLALLSPRRRPGAAAASREISQAKAIEIAKQDPKAVAAPRAAP